MLPVALNRTLRALRLFGLQAEREGGRKKARMNVQRRASRRKEWGTHGLLHLNRVNVHLGAGILERVVKYKDVLVVHVFSNGAFLKHFFLPASQALERASQRRIL
jgi:hypothetical protein